MTIQEYWNKVHLEDYSNTDWVSKPSIFAEEVVKFFPKTGRVLDIGTGQGGDAGFFQSLGYEVVATDFSDKALENARKKFKKVEFIKSDISKGLAFENESFDIVYSHMALHYFDKETTKKIFKDIYRVLKLNGILATITNTMNDPEKEIDNYVELEPDFYQSPGGITKRYFSVDSMRSFINDFFEIILLDNKGKTYKDDIQTLIRFIGRKKYSE